VLAQMPARESPALQRLSDLQHVNRLPFARDGQLPLRTWLQNAIALAGPRSEVDELRALLAKLPEKPTPAGGAAGRSKRASR
jgi:hypothetical protein